jgi:hypothetical protein
MSQFKYIMKADYIVIMRRLDAAPLVPLNATVVPLCGVRCSVVSKGDDK